MQLYVGLIFNFQLALCPLKSRDFGSSHSDGIGKMFYDNPINHNCCDFMNHHVLSQSERMADLSRCHFHTQEESSPDIHVNWLETGAH